MLEKQEASEFWTGQTLELQTDDGEAYITELVRVDDQLYVQRPLNSKNVPMLVSGVTQVKVSFYDNANQSVFTFHSSILINSKNEILIIKPHEDEIIRAQRRKLFRVQTGVEMRIGVYSRENPDMLEYHDLFTQDISGGGLAFLNRKKLVEPGDVVEGTLYLKTSSYQRSVDFVGKVIGNYWTEKEVFRTSLEFQEMKEVAKADIIKFCMYKQIELAKLVGDK